MAPPLAQSSPPGKEDQWRGETEKGKGGRNGAEAGEGFGESPPLLPKFLPVTKCLV